MLYADRRDAGIKLANELAARGHTPDLIVIALPRGGVPVAYEVANALHAPLDVLIVRKLGCPWNPELALGALASGNVVVENPDVLQLVENPRQVLDFVLEEQRSELARREHAYRKGMPDAEVAGRTVILVDDGAATGATMLVAVRSLRARGAAKIIVALPVASGEAVGRLREEEAEVICLQVPDRFDAVGSWYQRFPQIEDEEVTPLLAEARALCYGIGKSTS
jgi:putative phosphoribosyl transferase